LAATPVAGHQSFVGLHKIIRETQQTNGVIWGINRQSSEKNQNYFLQGREIQFTSSEGEKKRRSTTKEGGKKNNL